MPNHNQDILAQTSGLPGAPARVPAAAYLLTACIAVIGSNSLVLGPIAPEVARDLGVSVPVVMFGSSAFGLGTAASALFLARYIDRYGASRMLRLAMALLAAALGLSAVAPSIHLLIAAQLLAGLAAGIAMPAIYGSAAAIAPPGREGSTIGVVLTGWTISMVAGVSLSAVLADTVGWRAVFGMVAGLALVALGALASMPASRQKPGELAPSPFQALGTPGIRPLLLACGAFMTGFYGVYAYLGDHLNGALGQAVSVNGVAAIAYGVGFGAAALLDRFVDRFGARRVMPVAYACVGLIYLVMAAVSGSVGPLILTVSLWGLANHFGLNVLVMRLSALDPARRGTIMGLNSAVTYFAVFLGTSSFGPLYAGWGFAACALAGAALMVVAVAAASWRGSAM